MELRRIDPYQALFPLGIVCGLWGALVWVLFALGWVKTYPGLIHPDIMVGGFLFAFIAGFLMTAVPRFTGTKFAALWEILLPVVGIPFVLLFDVMSLLSLKIRVCCLAISSINMAVLIRFCVSRFRQRKNPLPPSFIFVGLGLGMGITGVIFQTLSAWNAIGNWGGAFEVWGRVFYYQGMILSLILGIFSQIGPMLLGYEKRTSSQGEMFLLAGIFFASFVVEESLHETSGRILRALVFTVVAFRNWQLHKAPPNRGIVPLYLRLVEIFILMGLWVYALVPPQAANSLHILFIGGFSFLALLIATRVTLAHGGYDLGLEATSKAIQWMGIFFLGAVCVRYFAPYIKTYFAHLAYASVLWILALGFWAYSFGPKLFFRSDPSTTANPGEKQTLQKLALKK